MRRWKDLGEFALVKIAEETDNFDRLFRRNLAPLVSEAPSHLRPKTCGVDQLNFIPSFRRFAICQHPNIRCDAGIVEKLFGQRDQRFEPVVLENPSADLTFPATSIARK